MTSWCILKGTWLLNHAGIMVNKGEPDHSKHMKACKYVHNSSYILYTELIMPSKIITT